MSAVILGRVPLSLPIKSGADDGLDVILGRVPLSLPIKPGVNGDLGPGGRLLEPLRA